MKGVRAKCDHCGGDIKDKRLEADNNLRQLVREQYQTFDGFPSEKEDEENLENIFKIKITRKELKFKW